MTSMYRAYALTMTRPQEKFGIPKPLSRELAENAPAAWAAFLGVLAVVTAIVYVAMIAMSSARGFQLRDAQNRVERLQGEARQLQTDLAKTSSVGAMTARAKAQGFVAVNAVETVDVGARTYVAVR